MAKTKEQLIDEAYANVLADRKRLEDSLAKIETAKTDDPAVIAAAVRASVVVTECMIKANAQLIELVKVESKNQPESPGDGQFSEKEANEMWDGIENESKDDAPAAGEPPDTDGGERKN